MEEKQHFDAESEKAKQDSDRQIEEENEKAKQEQTNQQQESQKEVEKLRGDWQSELDGKEEEYQKKAGKASKDQRKKIDDEKSKGEKDVDNKMTEAEQEAQKEKEAKQKEAEEKEKEKEEQSGWDRFWSAVGDFFAAIAEAIKGIFDALMDVISKIFEAVKEVVNGIIDLVRDAIIGLIEAFGEILKGIVKVVFAAFPEISKKFTDAIDGAVKKATEVVNKVADGLKKAVSFILDTLAEIVDTLLGVLRDVVAGAINLIGMIISGQIDEVIKGFGRIIEAGKAMPDVFEIAAQEELLGGDELNLHEPLSPEELAQAQESGIDIPAPEGENASQAGEAGEMPQAPWTQENVGVDEVDNNMELSPELTEELMQQTGGEGEAMLAESDDESRSMDAIMSEATGEQQAGGEQEQQQVPDDGLTPQQRADIKWQVMWDGIKQWFSDNWPILLAGLIAATAVIVAAIIASGGAVLAALPALLKVLAIVFAADLIAQISGHLRDYLTKAWDGDIQGGAKSLAKALALGAIELAMMLTLGAGKAVGKGAKAVGKAGKKAARGAGKVARKAGRGIAKGAKYTINKGKVLFKGIAGKGIGRNSKSLNELGENILKQTRFKKAKIKASENGKFEVKGCINPCNNVATGTTQGTSRGTKRPAPGGQQPTQPPAKKQKPKFKADIDNNTNKIKLDGRPEFDQAAKNIKVKPGQQDRRHVVGWDDKIKPAIEDTMGIIYKNSNQNEDYLKDLLIKTYSKHNLKGAPSKSASLEKHMEYTSKKLNSSPGNLNPEDAVENQAIEVVRQQTEGINKKLGDAFKDKSPDVNEVKNIMKEGFQLSNKNTPRTNFADDIRKFTLERIDNATSIDELNEILVQTKTSTGIDLNKASAPNQTKSALEYINKLDNVRHSEAQMTDEKRLEELFSILDMPKN